jgi:drug/metabolite transporter (DMT)-like permease
MSTILMGVLLLDEPMNLWVVAGTVLVLIGVYVVTSRRPAAGEDVTVNTKD